MKLKKISLILLLIATIFVLAACGRRNIKITFNTNGGSAVAAVTVKQNSAVEPVVTTREGYTFAGWYLDSEFNSEFILANGTARNITVYAKWNINQYTLTFNLENGEDNIHITQDYNSTFTYPANPTRVGYEFGGWFINQTHTTAFNATRIPSQNRQIYAKWIPVILTIDFVVNGEHYATRTVQHGQALTDVPSVPVVEGKTGVWSITDFSNMTESIEVVAEYTTNVYTVVIKDEFGTIYETLQVSHNGTVEPSVTPEKEGYLFIGYNENLTTFLVTENVDILVVYQQKVFTIIFENRDGGEISRTTVAYGQSVTAPTAPTIAGYTFKEWNSPLTNIQANKSIRAVYEANIYDIHFHAKEGLFDSNGEELKVLSKGYNELLGAIEAPKRLGYTFSGWYTTSDLTGDPVTFSDQSRMPLEGLTLYAKYQANQYTIFFNANGGETAQASKNVFYQSAIGTLPTPTRSGYIFNGWFDASQIQVVAADIFNQTTNLTLTAKWSVVTYTITYQNLMETTHENPVIYTTETTTITLSDPTNRLGYTFVGWFTQITGGSEVEEITLGSVGHRTLYARWSINQYTIAFNSAGGTAVVAITQNYNTAVTAPANPTRAGYTFGGWTPLVPANMPAENMTVTANWTINQYTITFNSAGGTSIEAITQNYGTEITAPADPNRVGYTFNGWSQAVPETMPAGSLTLTATWTVNQYTITFDSDGGSEVASITQNYNTAVSAPANPTRTGYTFNGWSQAVPATMPAGNITLTANWTINQYTITFNSAGGTAIEAITQNYGTEVTAPADPTRVGYTFNGWSQAVPATMPAGNLTLTALWTVNQYTITFDSNGGSAVASITAGFGATIIPPEIPTKVGFTFAGWDPVLPGTMPADDLELVAIWTEWPLINFDTAGGNTINPISQAIGSPVIPPADPIREGYTFVEWSPEIPATMPAEDVTLTAVWEINEYTISFDADGGTAVAAITQNYGTEITAPADPTRVGYTFNGWSQAVPETMPAENLTLTATWTVNQYTITFDSNGGSAVASITQNYNTAVSAPDNPTRMGYTFVEWSPEVPATMPAENLTLTASWSVVTYTITYQNLIGTTHENPVIYTTETTTITLSDPTDRVGYTFVGWFTQLTDGSKVEEIALGSVNDIVLYARWAINQYTITFDTDGGSAVTAIIQNYGTEISAPANPTREGYTFVEWNPEVPATMPAEDVTLIAVWEINEYMISFNTDGGSTVDDIIEDFGTTVIQPTSPTKTGYTFLRWVTEDEITFVFNTMPAHDVELFAVWEANDYIITLYPGAGTVNPLQKTVTYNAAIGTLPTPVYPGHQFVGWFFTIEYTSDTIYEHAENITLTAQYETIYYSVNLTNEFYHATFDGTHETMTGYNYNSNTEVLLGNTFLYGNEVSPIANYTGYEFHSFTYNSVTYTDLSDIVIVDDDMEVTVVYHQLVFEIDFIDSILVLIDDDWVLQARSRIRYIAYHGSFEALPEINIPANMAGYTAVWERQVFNEITTNIEVRALYYEVGEGMKIITFVSFDVTIYVVIEVSGGSTNVISGTSSLWNLIRTGSRFIGWYYWDEGTKVFLPQGEDLPFDTFTSSTILYAEWLELPRNTTPIIHDVEGEITNINEMTGVITIEFTPSTYVNPDDNTVEIQTYEFAINQNYQTTATLTNLVKNETGRIILVITDSHPHYDFFKVLLNPGKHIVEVRGLADGQNSLTSLYSAQYEYEVKSILDDDPTSVNVYDYFIIENYDGGTKRYVFYSNNVYQFSANTTINIIEGTNVSASGNILTVGNMPGNFRFEMTTGGVLTTYFGLVVKDIKQFAQGTSFVNYTSRLTNPNYLKDTTSQAYYVGYQNNFYLDIRMISNSGSRINLSDVLLTYEFTLNNDSSPLTSNELETYLSLESGNGIKFTSEASGHKFTIKVTPKYQATMMSAPQLTYVVTVNDGHNAFTNDDLQNLFKDMDVSIINIHRNITAELKSHQMNADGSPKNVAVDSGESAGQKGNVYERTGNNVENDQITIEGNFMVIDGSSLPYSNINSGSGHVGYAAAFEVVNVQVAIFHYNVHSSTYNAKIDDIDYNIVNDNHFIMNNLSIIGNTTTPSVNYGGAAEDILNEERLMSRNSGGYLGIAVRNGLTSFSNVYIPYTTIPFWSTSHGKTTSGQSILMELNDVKVDFTWANSLYTSGGAGFIVRDSFIGQSGGAAVHMEDARKGNDAYTTPTLDYDETVEFNNWISGQEAWFKAYTMTTSALALKGGIQSGVAPTGRSIIQTILDPVSGLPSEKMNLIMLTIPMSDAIEYSNPPTNTVISKASEVKYIVDGVAIQRKWDYLSTDDDRDPRIDSGTGQFGFAIGAYSGVTEFIGIIGELMASYSLDQASATMLAQIAGFYNLTAAQVIQVYGATQNPYNLNYDEAVEYLYPDHLIPKYIEVLTPIEGLGVSAGFATVLIELGTLESE